MTIEEARELLDDEFDSLPDEQIKALIDLITAVCDYVLTNQDTID